jgi:hypothetical protein
MFKCFRKRVQMPPFFCSSVSAQMFKYAGIRVQVLPQNATQCLPVKQNASDLFL